MTKKPIDYSKSCIYKICCKDPDITDFYIGSTTELTKRRHHHKITCINPNQVSYNSPVYKFIRDNGGWDNWEVVKIENYDCNCSEDLCKRERELFEELKPTLNKNRPIISVKETKEYQKEYRKTNNHYWKDYQKDYQREYRESNRDKINKRNAEKVQCECGTVVRKGSLSTHRKSDKHEKLLQQQQHQN